MLRGEVEVKGRCSRRLEGLGRLEGEKEGFCRLGLRSLENRRIDS